MIFYPTILTSCYFFFLHGFVCFGRMVGLVGLDFARLPLDRLGLTKEIC